MTCIAGLVDEGDVYIGGDSAGVSGMELRLRADQKVFTNGSLVMGFTDSFRMGQLLRYAFQCPPQLPSKSIEEFMVTDFIDAVRECLKQGGFAEEDRGKETGGTFLAGYRGRLFEISGDYQVGEALDGFSAVGSAAPVALGVLRDPGKKAGGSAAYRPGSGRALQRRRQAPVRSRASTQEYRITEIRACSRTIETPQQELALNGLLRLEC